MFPIDSRVSNLRSNNGVESLASLTRTRVPRAAHAERHVRSQVTTDIVHFRLKLVHPETARVGYTAESGRSGSAMLRGILGSKSLLEIYIIVT